MPLGKQAKILSDAQIRAALNHVTHSRYPLRDRVMILMSTKAGMRAKEISQASWAMVTESDGATLSDQLALTNAASKGKRGGRNIPLHPDLKTALQALHAERGDLAKPDWPIIHSERAKGMSAGAVTVWFHRLYATLGFHGASSHSGRRTFITRAARKIVEAGGSLRDVQDLAGHSSLTTTQRYIAMNEEAKKKVVSLI